MTKLKIGKKDDLTGRVFKKNLPFQLLKRLYKGAIITTKTNTFRKKSKLHQVITFYIGKKKVSTQTIIHQIGDC